MSNGGDIRIEAARAATDEVRGLIVELDRVLSAEYPPSSGMAWTWMRSFSRISGSSWRD